jgi:sirohydrochlorin ferrochelatase
LSVDASHESEIELVVAPLVVRPLGADGLVVSGHAMVALLMTGRAETLPAASNASTPKLYAVPHVKPLNAYWRVVVEPTFVDPR